MTDKMFGTEGIFDTPGRITMGKDYLSIPGIDYLGHAVFHKADAPLETHIHNNCMEFVFVVGGGQGYYIGDDYYQLVGGEGFISFMSQPHRSDENYQGVGEIYWMQLNLSCNENFLGYNRELSMEITGRLQEIDRHTFRFGPSLKKLLKSTFDEFRQKGTTITGLSSLMHLVSGVIECVHKGAFMENDLIELDKYIKNHINDDLSIEDLSKASGFSVSTIQHRFKNYFGRSPGEYINYMKIKKSKEYLIEGRSVTETAMILGFNTSDYFSTVFKKFNGVSPLKWVQKKRIPQ